MPGMSVADAAFNTAHDYPHGGAAALGARMGKSNLSAEVNPDRSDAKLGLLDAVKMQRLAGDCRVLYAMASELEHFPPMPMPRRAAGADQQCMRAASAVVKESADVVTVTAESLEDDKVTDNELARFDREWSELIVAGQVLRQLMAEKNAALKARAV